MNQKSLSLVLGIVTIICWGSLATFGKLLIHLPPFFVLGVTFLIGSIPGWFKFREMFISWKITLWGVLGFFGYHFFLFYAFRYAPPVEANLINYMWPVIMVMVTPLVFPGERLRFYHVIGAILAVCGSVLLVFGKGGELRLENSTGYLFALGAALTWPLYSIGRKKLPATPVWSVGSFCLGSGILSFITHALVEPSVTLTAPDVLKLIAMGVGPVGLAFYCWDIALRNGDAKILGALAYLTPVLSTLGLVFFGGEVLAFTTAMAMVLIIGGASAGLLDFFPPKR